MGKPRGVGKLEWGGNGRGWGGRGQFTSNLGTRWTGSHHTRGGIPSKKEGIGKGNWQKGTARGYQQGVRLHFIFLICIYVFATVTAGAGPGR